MARNGRMSFRTDGKSEVLRKLQGRIYFEKSLSESSASEHGNPVALPSWFVQEHGDKFRQFVILRSELSAKSWNVKLTIQYESSAYSRQVKFSAGWRGFASSNGLLAGDSLIFLLTAMSEFMVHIFPGSRNPKRFLSELGPKQWSDGSEPSRKRARQAYENKDDRWANGEGGSEGTVRQSNGVFAKKKTVGEERNLVSASTHSSTSWSLSSSSKDLYYFESENVREPALDLVELMVSGVTENVISEKRGASMAKKGRMPFSADDKTKVLRKFEGRIHFEKTLSTTNSSHLSGSTLTLPAWFVKEHGDKFHKSVLLRTESSSKPWDVKLTVECRSSESARVIFSGGWKAFADFNKLLAGDLLIFCLTARSEFEVYIFRGTRNPEGRWLASQAPRERSDRSELSREREEQPYECKDERVTADRSIVRTVKLKGRFAKKREEWMVSDSGLGSKFCTRLLVCPNFSKKLSASNIYYRGTACMEIPLDFCKTYGSRLDSHVELQGIHEESQVRTMACRATHGNPVRHFLRAEWRVFANENNLGVGQELLFTLTADSFFVVREVLPASKEMQGR